VSARRLYLLRHAEAGWQSGPGDDHDRPLTARGLRRTHSLGHALHGAGRLPDLILCSTARRCTQTVEALLDAAAPRLAEPEMALDESLYLCSAQTLLARLRALPTGTGRAMAVGHHPAIQEAALALLPQRGPARSQVAGIFAPGTLVVLDLPKGAGWPDLAPGAAELAALHDPEAPG